MILEASPCQALTNSATWGHITNAGGGAEGSSTARGHVERNYENDWLGTNEIF